MLSTERTLNGREVFQWRTQCRLSSSDMEIRCMHYRRMFTVTAGVAVTVCHCPAEKRWNDQFSGRGIGRRLNFNACGTNRLKQQGKNIDQFVLQRTPSNAAMDRSPRVCVSAIYTPFLAPRKNYDLIFIWSTWADGHYGCTEQSLTSCHYGSGELVRQDPYWDHL